MKSFRRRITSNKDVKEVKDVVRSEPPKSYLDTQIEEKDKTRFYSRIVEFSNFAAAGIYGFVLNQEVGDVKQALDTGDVSGGDIALTVATFGLTALHTYIGLGKKIDADEARDVGVVLKAEKILRVDPDRQIAPYPDSSGNW